MMTANSLEVLENICAESLNQKLLGIYLNTEKSIKITNECISSTYIKLTRHDSNSCADLSGISISQSRWNFIAYVVS